MSHETFFLWFSNTVFLLHRSLEYSHQLPPTDFLQIWCWFEVYHIITLSKRPSGPTWPIWLDCRFILFWNKCLKCDKTLSWSTLSSYPWILIWNYWPKIQCLKVTQKGLILLTWSCMHAWLDFPILRYCSGTVSDSAMIVREIKIKIQDEFMVIWKLPINWQQVS